LAVISLLSFLLCVAVEETTLGYNRNWKIRAAWNATLTLIFLLNIYVVYNHCVRCNGLEGVGLVVCIDMVAVVLSLLVPLEVIEEQTSVWEELKTKRLLKTE
jgi:hypothetical protein